MVSVVIPAFNEEDAVAVTVADVRAALSSVSHEVLVVDDGSSDETASRAIAAGAKVLSHPHNLGYGAAVMTGIRGAANDTVVITDADGTYPHAEIPRLLQEFGKGFNMVVGARAGAQQWDSAVKAPLRIVLKWLVEFTTGRPIPDVNSGLRVFSKAEIVPYFGHLCNTFSFTTSLTLAYLMTSKFVAFTPIAYNKRIGETKVRLLRDSLRTLQYIVQAIVYYNPLKMFLLMCALIGVVSLGSLALAAAFGDPRGLYLGVGGLLIAILVFCLGLLAELLKQIMTKR